MDLDQFLEIAGLPSPRSVPQLGAISEYGVHEHLRVGHIRSGGELHDLWAIDSEAYGEASITYEKFEDWWRSYPSGLRAIFFRTRVMGAIGICPSPVLVPVC